MKKIRMAYLVSRYPAISHTFILREIRTLRGMEFDIQVASINVPDRDTSDLTREEQEEEADTYYVKADRMGAVFAIFYTLFTTPIGYFRGLWYALTLGGMDLKKIIYNFFYFVEAVMVGQWMRSYDVTHLHVHFASQAATVAWMTHKIFSITYSITVHGPDEFYNTEKFYLREKILDARFVCCISHFARSQLMMLSPFSEWDKIEISPLGVNPDVFKPRTFRTYPDVFEILCVGRLVSAKGQYILVQAVGRLLSQGRKVRLRYVGDGPDRAMLEEVVHKRALKEHILFEGAVNQDRILEFYEQADVFALASFAEGVPVVLMEAMVMEIPCVTTHITGIPELIEKGQGLLVPPSDADALANAIAVLIANADLRREMGKKAREKVLNSYELQRNTQRLGNIFRRYLES